MKKIAIAAIAVLSLSACGSVGTVGIGDKVKTIDTPDGPVVCVIVTAQGGGSIGVDCNWDKTNGNLP